MHDIFLIWEHPCTWGGYKKKPVALLAFGLVKSSVRSAHFLSQSKRNGSPQVVGLRGGTKKELLRNTQETSVCGGGGMVWKGCFHTPKHHWQLLLETLFSLTCGKCDVAYQAHKTCDWMVNLIWAAIQFSSGLRRAQSQQNNCDCVLRA